MKKYDIGWAIIDFIDENNLEAKSVSGVYSPALTSNMRFDKLKGKRFKCSWNRNNSLFRKIIKALNKKYYATNNLRVYIK